MSGRAVVTEVLEEDEEVKTGPQENIDLQSNGILQTNSTGNPIDASNQQNLTEIQRQLLAVDASERVLNATTTLLAASRVDPPQVFWEDIQRAPESPGFWSVLKDLPKEFLISFGVGLFAFLYLMAGVLKEQFVWVVLVFGIFLFLYAGLDKFSRANEVAAITQVRAGQRLLVENVNTITQHTALKMKEQTHQMHSETLQTVKDVETIRANTSIVVAETEHKIATVNAGKDIKLKEINEESETTRARLRNQHAKDIAEMQANANEQIEQRKQALEQQRIISHEKIQDRMMKIDRDKHNAEQETTRKIAELEREKERKRIEHEALMKMKQVEAELNMHETRQRSETERKRIEAEAATNRTREEFAYKTREAVEETRRTEIREREDGFCVVV